MDNSVQCPLCAGGIGHSMDINHAVRVKELLDLVKDLAKFAPLSLEQRARQAIAKAEANT